MEYLKIKVNNEDESKEIQELLFEFGCYWAGRKNKDTVIEATNGRYIFSRRGEMTYCESSEVELNGVGFSLKEITLQYLRDLVVLKRNSINDATHYYGGSKYYLTDSEFYQYLEGKWVNIDQYVDGMTFKKIEKGCEVKMKEYLVKNMYGEYKLTDHHSGFSAEELIEVPEGAEEYRTNYKFYKNNGELFYSSYDEWVESGLTEYIALWKRDTTEHKNKTEVSLGSNKEEVKMKEYLDKEYRIRKVKQTSGDSLVPSGWIEVPEGAEILYFDKRYEPSNHFFKTVDGKSYYKYLKNGSKWMEYSNKGLNVFKDNIDNFHIMWQRNPTAPNTAIQEKLKFIEKWLNGEKIQYILGVESEKTQWYNFTEGAMQYIKRSDIKFRKAPKYVTINGIEFKNVKSLLKHIKNNFDLEDGE